MKTYDLISINLKEKRKKKKNQNISPHALSHPMFVCYFLLFFCFFVFIMFLLLLLLLLLLFWIHGSYYFIRFRFYPEIIYFFSVHFILNELNPNHFLTSEIFLKILSLKSLTTYHPENRKNIPLVLEFDETFLSH